MSAKVYGNIHGERMLIRVVVLPDTEKSTIEEVKALREEVKNRVKYDGETYLSGFRATIRKEPYGIVLRSYQTDVAVMGFDGKFRKTWDGYSATTLKHVNMFREKFKFGKLNKREWVELPLG